MDLKVEKEPLLTLMAMNLLENLLLIKNVARVNLLQRIAK